jgi:hypothetical protein
VKQRIAKQPGERQHAGKRAGDRRSPLLAERERLGNRAFRAALEQKASSPGDSLEREADRIASHIDDAPAGIAPASPRLRTQPDGAAASPPDPIRQGLAASGRGEPLAPSMRAAIEPRLGADLGEVRVHRDAQAARLNHAMSARAFAYGSHIWLGEGESPGDRRLMAHELVHTVQQTGPGATPAIQRTPKVAMREWRLDHSDVAGGDEVTALNVAVSQLGVDETAAQFFGWTTEERPLWAAKKGLYVRAIDFLRDNRALFDVPDIHETLDRALQFCDDSAVTVASLTDTFYEDMLIAAVYSAAPGSASFSHRMLGGATPVPGRKAGATDFAPSGDSGALLRKDPRPVKQATGGAGSSGELLVEYGALPGTVASKQASGLIETYKGRTPRRLRSQLARVASDPMLYATLNRFFGDGGRFIFQGMDALGHYTPGKTPQIEINEGMFPGSGVKAEQTEIGLRGVIAHELYHYALDRADAFITESGVGGGGNDHPLIGIIQDRYVIAETLRTGGSLLDENIEALDGWVGRDHKPDLRNFIQGNDIQGMLKRVRQADFMEDLTFTKAVDPLGTNQAALSQRPGTSRTHMIFDPSQSTDMVYLCAVNAMIIKRALELAALYADEHGIALSKVFGDPGYIREIGAFMDKFIVLASKNRDEGVGALALRTALN